MPNRIDSPRSSGPLAPPAREVTPVQASAPQAPNSSAAAASSDFDATSKGTPPPAPERPPPARDLGFEAVHGPHGPSGAVVPPDKDGPVDPSLPNRPNGPGKLMNFEWWCNGGLARGNQPTTQRIDDLAHKFGFKSVINLRAEDNSDQATCQKDGLNYLHVNWVDKTAPTEAQIKQILDFATQGPNQPAYIHCFAGENRTSLAVACYRMACEGWPLDKARQEANGFGMHEPVQEQFLTQFASDLAAGKIQGYPLKATPPPPPPGGTEQLFEEGQAGAKPILDAIKGAKKSVDLSIYLMTDPSVLSALESAAKRGVSVRVMIEPHPVGNGTSDFAALKKQLEAAGAKVEPTPPQFDSSNNVDHAKFMVVDGASTLIGTGNLVRSSLEGGATGDRDFWLQDSRPESATEAEQLFNADWNRTKTDPSSFQNLVVTPDNAPQRMLGLIDGAQKTLLVYNQELADPDVINHLIAAKKRGVDVQVLAAAPKNGGPDKNGPIIQQLKAAGIPAKEMTKNYLHAKAMVADGQAFIGSQNFSVDGLTKNRELGEIVSDAGVVGQLAQAFQSDWSTN
jgi:cardiolipin synthase A/B